MKKDLSKYAAKYYKQKAESVIQKDLQYVYSFMCIELFDNHGFSTEDLADLLDKVQQRWVQYAADVPDETPVQMCERITGIRLIT